MVSGLDPSQQNKKALQNTQRYSFFQIFRAGSLGEEGVGCGERVTVQINKRQVKQFAPEGKHSTPVSSRHSPWQGVLLQYNPLTHNEGCEQQDLGRASLLTENAFFQVRVPCSLTRDKIGKS